MKKLLYVLPCAALALVVACEKKPNDVPSSTETTSAQPTPPSSLAREDRDFVTKAAQGGLLEVELGKRVSAKATSAEVKAFADHMVADHGKANDELKQLASKKGVTLSDQLDEDHKKKVDELGKLSGVKLDKEYADDMVDDHVKDVTEFRDASKELKDPELRAWATKTLPTLEHHLTMAKEVKAKTEKAKEPKAK